LENVVWLWKLFSTLLILIEDYCCVAMRILRAKQVRKTLRFFRMVCNIVPTYHVLMDGTYIAAHVAQRLDPTEQLVKALQGASCEFWVPSAVLRELESLGLDEALKYAQQLRQVGWEEEQRQAQLDEPQSASDSVLQIVGAGNADGYLVASNDKALRVELGKLGRVPLLYSNVNTTVLEPPSRGSVAGAAQGEGSKSLLSAAAEAATHKLQKEERRRARKETPAVNDRRKLKARGPNPLSMKKRKAGADDAKPSQPQQKRLRRRAKGGGGGGGASAE
jgi:U3 small nucleolar RNA-associated protein 23